MKQRLSNLDVSVLCKIYTNELVGSRLINIYDGGDTKTYILKFNSNTGKKYLLLESSFRMHLIDSFCFNRVIPTSFCAKFRKHLKNKRLEKIEQVGNDRIIDMQFGEGDYCYHLILELFASGNVILTDKDYKILNTLRRYIYDDDNKILVSQVYPMELASKYNLEDLNYLEITDWFRDKVIKEQLNNKHNILKYLTFQDSPLSNIPQIILSHSLKQLGINPNNKIGLNWNNFTKLNFKLIIDHIVKILETIKDITHGYIILDDKGDYIDFTPYLFTQYHEKKYIFMDSYGDIVSTYFGKSKPLVTKETIKTVTKKDDILDKHERKNYNITKQITNLDDKSNNNLSLAELIQSKLEHIDSIIKTINQMLEYNTTKTEIQDKLGIQTIDFKNKCFDISISDIKIKIYYDRNVYKNLTLYHLNKKHYLEKKTKAIIILESSKKSGKSKNITKIIEKINLDNRKKYWFEDYRWFYSSDGYIIISGRNAEQNEVVVKKYLEKNDIYVHTDFHGSSSCVIKNHTPDVDIPISTLEQAGNFVICWSKSWTSVIPDRAYWVYSEQVSKTAPTGEYLSTGSMMIRGSKNYLSMATMELGICLLFQIKGQLPIDNNYRFVSNLHKGMEIISCIPMCGPYKSGMKFDYKVKLVPGTQKRTLAFKHTISSFKRNKYITNDEAFIYSLSNNDFDTIVPFKIRKI